MKVNKRNLIELILQIFFSVLYFLPGFGQKVNTDYEIVDGVRELDYTHVYDVSLYSQYKLTTDKGVVLIVFLSLFLAVLIYQLLSKGKLRNWLVIPIFTVIEMLFFIQSAFDLALYHKMYDSDTFASIYEGSIVSSPLFYIVLIMLIALNVITIWGYIKAKKFGILDEPLSLIKKTVTAPGEANIEYGEAYRNIAMHVFLCIITLGIWYLIWLYKTTNFLNKTPNSEQYSPVKKLLLCMFIPMYQTYWFYKHGAKVDAFCQHKGIQNNYLTIICALIPIPLVSSVIMQDKINQICASK